MVVITGDGWVLFQGPVCTSKYRKKCFAGWKMAIKYRKNQEKSGMDWWWCWEGTVFRVQCAFPNMETFAFPLVEIWCKGFWKIVVALSLTFLNLLKSCDLVLFSWRKMQKTKKNAALFKIFYIISPQGEHFRTWFKQILEATVQGYNFRFWSIFRIWSCDQPPNHLLVGPW